MPPGGQIAYASLVCVPKKRDTLDDNKQIKEGKTPDGQGRQAEHATAEGRGRPLVQEA